VSHPAGITASSRTIRLNNTTLSLAGWSWEPQATSSAGSTLTAISRGQVKLLPGENTLSASVCAGSVCGEESATYTYQPPPPPAPHQVPSVSILRPGGWADPTRYGSTLSYATPAYISDGIPHSITLLYTSESAYPVTFLQADVTDWSTDPAKYLSVAVLDSLGNPFQLTNGGYAAFWKNVGGVSGTVSRLGAQVNGFSQPTGAHRYTLRVRSHWDTANWQERRDTVRVPMVNRAGSPYGAGWTIAGLQRLYPLTGGILIDEGTGAVSWFPSANGVYTAPDGDHSTIAYNPTNQTYTRTWPDSTVMQFAGNGLPVMTYTRLGDTTRYTFSGGDRLTSRTDPAGKSFQFQYNANNKLSAIVDPGGRTTRVTITNGLLTQILGPDSVTALGAITYTTHSSGNSTRRLASYLDHAGGQWNVTYDSYGAVASVTAPAVTLASGANQRPRVTATSEKARVLTAEEVENLASMAARVQPDSVYARVSDARGNVTRTWSDRMGLPVRVIGPVNDTTVVTRDAHGEPVSVRYPTGHVVNLAYTPVGQLTTRVDETRGTRTDFGYTGSFVTRQSDGTVNLWFDRGTRGEINAVRRGTNPVPLVQYRYDSRMRVDSVIDAGGHLTEYFYDGNTWGNVDSLRVVTPVSRHVTSLSYDAYGRPFQVRDPAGAVLTRTFDALNRTLKERVPGDSVRYGYFGADSAVVTDAEGKRYTTAFNRLGWTAHPAARASSAGTVPVVVVVCCCSRRT
jgi:YD repeat-containing protein